MLEPLGMRFSVTYNINGVPELPLDYRGGFVALIKYALNAADYKEQTYDDIYKSSSLSFAIRFDGRPRIRDGRILIGNSLRLYVSSTSLTLGTAVYNGLLLTKEFQINKIKITNPLATYIKENVIRSNFVVFATLSPIIIRHYQYRDKYVLPSEEGFEESLLNALSEQVMSYNNNTSISSTNNIKIDILKFKKVVMTHYGGLVLGFTGVIKMSAQTDILKFFYQSGIGYRRSNGFGFVQVDS